MGAHLHKVLSVNEEANTLECAHCGSAKIKWVTRKGKRAARCKTAYNLSRTTDFESLRTNYSSKRPHGLTTVEAQAFRAGKTCAICGSDKDLVVDHNHETGKIRGVLCSDHNKALGFFRDNIADMAKAIQYLNENN